MSGREKENRPRGFRPSRRGFLAAAAGAPLLATRCAGPGPEQQEEGARPTLALQDFQPRSMLKVPEHQVTRAKYPVIDAHTHVAGVFRRPGTPDSKLRGTPAEQFAQIVRWMDEMNLKLMVNFTSDAGELLDRCLKEMVGAHPGRFVTCVVPSFENMKDPGYPKRQAEEIRRAKEKGAVAIKLYKSFGLGLREDGKLVKIDDARFAPMFEEAGGLGMPVFIHTADPDAFFLPIDRFNERWEELANHPDWSFYGKDYPSKPELLAARNRIIDRHPKTTFVGLHVANHPENLDEVSAWLDKYPNLYCEIGARLGELGRQPRRARKFFEQYQDRILFGTDASPNGVETPQQILIPEMYHCYFRFLETLDEYFDYAPAPVPPQGRWKIYGVGLPDGILKKVYHNNAARLLGLEAV